MLTRRASLRRARRAYCLVRPSRTRAPCTHKSPRRRARAARPRQQKHGRPRFCLAPPLATRRFRERPPALDPARKLTRTQPPVPTARALRDGVCEPVRPVFPRPSSTSRYADARFTLASPLAQRRRLSTRGRPRSSEKLHPTASRPHTPPHVCVRGAPPSSPRRVLRAKIRASRPISPIHEPGAQGEEPHARPAARSRARAGGACSPTPVRGLSKQDPTRRVCWHISLPNSDLPHPDADGCSATCSPAPGTSQKKAFRSIAGKDRWPSS